MYKRKLLGLALGFGFLIVGVHWSHPNPVSKGEGIYDLSLGESVKVKLKNGQSRTLTLLNFHERTEPYFESAFSSFTSAVVAADLEVEVDEVKVTFPGGPFRMPISINGLSVLLSLTQGWTGGIDPEPLSKAVRLEVQDASLPWVGTQPMTFPIRNYLWQCSNYMHTFLGIAVNQQKLYYHRGEDYGMIPDREAVLAMSDGTIVTMPGSKGDGESNSVAYDTFEGSRIVYDHMNSPHIRSDLGPGRHVRIGEVLGLTGNTWQGKPVDDPHLHVEVQAGTQRRNSFPCLVAAYQQSHPGAVLSIGGGWRHVWKGDTIELDGFLSIASPGRKIVKYEWTFHDGQKASTSKAHKAYTHAGTYSEQLQVTDDRGTSDLGFTEVFVLDREVKRPPPFGWINYYPVHAIRPGTVVQFLVRSSNMRPESIDYGDGTCVPWKETTEHSYKLPGLYVVTFRGGDSGSGVGVFHVRVVVD
jgi:murein DD-endopeptidase MepM/ murein hydrolase activator NlpD